MTLESDKIQESVTLKLIKMSNIKSKKVEWLWYPYIPFGKITIIQGDPGEGKTKLALELGAKLTKGEHFDSEQKLEPMNVIYQTAEDGLADTIKPRLESAGADCERILVIDDAEKPLTMLDERIEMAIKKTGARMLILDPIQAYIGATVDINKANEIRPSMKRLGDIAEKYNCAIILIGHMNKGGASKAIYRGLGGIDFAAAARSVLLVARDPDNEDVRVIAPVKSSLEKEGNIVAFQLGENNSFKWLGDYDIDKDTLLYGFSTGDKYIKARNLLEQLLAGGMEISANEIKEKALALNISWRTLEKAKKDLEIESVKEGKIWIWRFKKDECNTARV